MTPKLNRPPTIYDVAKAADVSISTVSRVINASPNVSEVTRERVQEAINQLAFVPKAEARARAMKDFARIGVLTPFFTAPAFVQRLRGVAEGLMATRYELTIYTVESIDHLNHYLATLPVTGHLEGLILLSLRVNDESALKLKEHNLETVLIEYPRQDLNTVEINDVEGGKMAAEYLIGKGHQRLAFLGDTTDLGAYAILPITLRLQGFKHGVRQAGLSLPEEFICTSRYDVKDAERNVEPILRRPDRPTAIFCATDMQAWGVVNKARQLGLRVPEDLAVLGFDDLDFADYVGLSTIHQPLDESGRLAVEILLSHLKDPERPLRHIRLPLKIVERQTT
ncbi:MAG: LacI family transcriptional regulator [Brevefilum sp.]|nr:LacI family transcriptional regulator [Brevefilum sp.]